MMFKLAYSVVIVASFALVIAGCSQVAASRGINSDPEAAAAARAKAIATAAAISAQKVAFRKSPR